MSTVPMARYRDDLIGFVRDFTALKQPTLVEQIVMRQFQEGRRTGLGLRVWHPDSLLRCMFFTYAVISWKTLCFERQLTGIYARSVKHGAPWMDGFALFASNCDPVVGKLFQFGISNYSPGLTVRGDEYWRVLAFNPNESEMQSAQSWLSNVVYYDFDSVPQWLVRASQQAVKRPGVERPVSFSLMIGPQYKPYDATPPPYREADGSSNSDD